jgi:hypothetical protein
MREVEGSCFKLILDVCFKDQSGSWGQPPLFLDLVVLCSNSCSQPLALSEAEGEA